MQAHSRSLQEERDSVIAALGTHTAETVGYLAGLSGDGSSNNAVMGIANRVIMATAVIVAALFAWKMTTTYFNEKAEPDKHFGGKKTKALLSEAVAFMVAEGLIASIWALVNYGQQIVGGGVS